MKEDIKLAGSVCLRWLTCGFLTFFIFFSLNLLLNLFLTDEDRAYVYRLVDGEYVLLETVEIDGRDSFTPPPGDDISVSYGRGAVPLPAKIVSYTVTQALSVFIQFKMYCSVLAKPGKRALKEGGWPRRGLRVGFMAALPNFVGYVAYVIMVAAGVSFARYVAYFVNLPTLPLLLFIISCSDNPGSVANALCAGLPILLTPLLVLLAFRFGNGLSNVDFSSMMYQKSPNKKEKA